MPADIIPLADYRARWIAARVVCGWCGYRWHGAFPAEADFYSLECPECGQWMGEAKCVCLYEGEEDYCGLQ